MALPGFNVYLPAILATPNDVSTVPASRSQSSAKAAALQRRLGQTVIRVSLGPVPCHGNPRFQSSLHPDAQMTVLSQAVPIRLSWNVDWALRWLLCTARRLA